MHGGASGPGHQPPPVMMTGSSGWKHTLLMLWLCPSRVCTHALVW